MTEGSAPRILIVIPAFNEEGSIGATLAELRRACPWADVVVVDDGSTDGTAAVVRASGCRLLPLPFNLGAGAAVQTGLQHARMNDYDVAVQVDADGQHPAREVPRLVEPVLAGDCDVCIGSRFLDGERRFRQTRLRALGIAVLARVLSVVVGQRVTDPTSGFRAFGRSAVRRLADEYPDDFPDPEVLAQLRKSGLKALEIPVAMEPRRAGRSSLGPRLAFLYVTKNLLAVFVSLFRRNETVR